ncbi:ribosome biogenesis protein NOP53 [Neocloeon triangulifer]|uniref:ribosome biogenesis protein NOP53 n=1 Tax=Neocloeon triangulifer TaxID=2078957 RepID=UPI00286F4573|nr:ribosome biogenesis protein NOP53 [Neocloeon triangulifer]
MAAKVSSARKKRVSKKSKSSWRSKSDVQDVEDFLEAQRTEQIQGGPVSSKPDAQLFTIDTKARKIRDVAAYLSRKDRARQKPLRCFAALENDSAVQDPVIKRNKVRLPGEGKGIARVRRLQNTAKRLKKEAQSLEDSAAYSANKPLGRDLAAPAALDVWGDEYGSVKLPIDEQWLAPKTLVHTIENVHKKVGVRSRFSRVRNSKLPAIEAPHPGESYNPSLEDHQDLLQQVVHHETALLKKEKHLERVTTKMFCKRSQIPTEEEKLKELAQGLPVPGEEVVDDEVFDSEYKALNPPVINKKKTLQKRKRLQTAREDQLRRFSEKMEKKKISDIDRLKKVEEEMRAETEEMARNKVLKLQALAKKELQPKKMANYNFEAAELDFNLPKDIKGNVRQLKAEGSILADRFKSMQKRNVIETRVRQKVKRKFRPKRFVKASHKIDP